MNAAETAWAATGAPYPLAEVPKPTDIPDEHPATVGLHQLTPEQITADLTAYADVEAELRSVADYLPEYSSAAVHATLGRAHDNLEEAAGTIRALSHGAHLEYGVLWDEHLDGYHDITRPYLTREDAQVVLDGAEYTGHIVVRLVLTTEWRTA